MFHALDLQAADLRLGRPAKDPAKRPLQAAPGHWYLVEHILDCDAFAGVIADEPNGRGQVGILDGEHIRRAARDDTDGTDVKGFYWRRGTGHHPFDEGGCLVADFAGVGGDAGKRRIAKIANDVVVVHTDYSHFVGDGDPYVPASVQNLLAARIVAGHQPHRLGQLTQPSRQILLVREAVLLMLGDVTTA